MWTLGLAVAGVVLIAVAAVLISLNVARAAGGVSFVVGNSATGNAVNFSTITGWQAGDIALVFAYRDGSATAPGLPAGFTGVTTAGGNTNSARLAYRVLQAGDASYTFTNATEVEVMIVRGASGVSATNFATANGTGNAMSYTALPSAPAASSWVLGFGGHRTATNVNSATAGSMTVRSAGTDTALGMHSITGVTSFPLTGWSTVNASSGWTTLDVEVLADTTNPVTAAVTTPADGSAFRAATVPSSFAGTAADDTNGSGLLPNSTTFVLRRHGDGWYWNGSTWQAGVANLSTTHGATSGGTAAAWTSSATLPSSAQWAGASDGTYTVQATATDKAGNSYTGTAVTFTLDNTSPSAATVTSPASGGTYRAASVPTFAGSAADNAGGTGLLANSTAFTLQRASDGDYWNGSAWQPTTAALPSTHGSTSGGTSTAWTSSATMPDWYAQAGGVYTVQATATDAVGNTLTGTAVSFTLLATPYPSSATGSFTATMTAGHVIYTFTGGGSLTPTAALTADVLIVAGGGGGGGAQSNTNPRYGGGGGAGGFVKLTGSSLTSGSAYGVTVGTGGGGGTSGTTTATAGTSGGGSAFGSTSAAGGGGGGAGSGATNGQPPLNGLPGGSGGGGGRTTAALLGTGGAATPAGQGSPGVAAASAYGGGGGGANGTGTTSTGGAGKADSTSGSSVTYATGGNGATAAGSGAAATTPGGGGGGGWHTVGTAGVNGIVIVNYALPNVTLSYTAGSNGSIVGTTLQSVAYGGTGSAVSAVPSTGYHFVNWSDGNTSNPRTDANVIASVNVTANFAINTYTLVPSTGANGSISPNTTQTVNFGGSSTFAVSSNTGYHIADVQVDGGSIGASSSVSFLNVSANHTISASFAINTYRLRYLTDGNGTLSGSTSQTVNYGGSGTPVTASANANYRFWKWSDGVTTATRQESNVTADATVTALFQRQLTVTATGVSRTYDGSTVATVTLSSSDIQGGDVVTFTCNPTSFTDKNVGVGKAINVAGIIMGGPDASKYFLMNTTATATATISAHPLTISAVTSSKVYDGTTASSGIPTTSGLQGTDTVSGLSEAFDSKGVGASKVLSVQAGYVVNDGNSGGNYTVSTSTASGSITPRDLTVSATAHDRTYDGSTAASATLASNKVSGDAVTLSYSTAYFNDKHVGTNKPVTVAGISIGGADAANYNLTNTMAFAPATIAAAPLSVTAVAASKVYDGSTISTGVPTVSGLVGSDTATGLAQAFDSKAAGFRSVSVSSFTIQDGNSGLDYTVTTFGAAGLISAKGVAVTGAVAQNKPYDGTASATVDFSAATVVGTIPGDVAVLDTSGYQAQFAEKTVGTWPVTVTGVALSGADAGNYAVSQPMGLSATIGGGTTLTVSGAVASDKTYDGSTAATVDFSGAHLVGVANGDDVTLVTGAYSAAFNTKDAGQGKSVTLSGLSLSGADAGNYSLVSPSLSATVTARPLHVSATGHDKAYDGSRTASITLASDKIPGDTVNLSYNTAQFDTKDVGSDKPVTVSGIAVAGADATDYDLASATASTTASITRVSLVGHFAVQDKIYDGSSAATVTSRSLDGAVAGDDVSLSGGTASFADKNAGTGKTVTLTAATLTGADAGNYALGSVANSLADISAKNLTVSGAQANDKMYDGSATATVDFSGATLVGAVSGDSVALDPGGYSATFSSKDVGTWPVTVSGVRLSGADKGNYTVSQPSGLSASITGATILTVSGASANSRPYDGTTTATVDFSHASLVGVSPGDDVSLVTTLYSASFDTKDVGSGKTVSVTGLTLSGADADNYALASLSLSADVTPLHLTGSFTASDKVYDGDTSASVLSRGLVGAVPGDDVYLSGGTAEFDTKDAGTHKAVTLVDAALAGADEDDYALDSVAAASADIKPKALTVTAADLSKTWGDPVVFMGTEFVASGTVDGDAVTGVTLTSMGAAASASVLGSPYAIVPSNAVGTGLSNYDVTYENGELTVNPKSLTTAVISIPPAPNGNGWYTTMPVTTLVATSTSAPVPPAWTYWWWNSSAPQTYTAEVTPPDEGVQVLHYYSVDQDDPANREATQTVTFQVDTKAPVAPSTVTAVPASTSSIDVLWAPGTDSSPGSGLDHYVLYVDQQPWGDVPLMPTSLTVNGLAPNSTHTFRVAAVDAAGLTSGPSSAFAEASTFAFPPLVTTATVVPETPEGLNSWYVTTPTVSLTTTPSDSASTFYAWDSSALATYTAPLSAPPGIHTLSFWSVDSGHGHAQEATNTISLRVDPLPDVREGSESPVGSIAATAAIVTDTSVLLNWVPVSDPYSGTDHYEVWGDTVIGSAYTPPYLITDLSPTTAYSFRIYAVNGAGTYFSSSATITATTTSAPLPVPPSTVAVQAVDGERVFIDWQPVSSHIGAVGYGVWRSTDGVNYSQIATVTGQYSSEYVDSGLRSSTRYWYAVSSFDDRGASELSDTSSDLWPNISALTGRAQRPEGVKVIEGSGSVLLSWAPDTNPAVNSYVVTRSDVSLGATATLGTVASGPAPSFDDTGVVDGSPYWYRVWPVDASGTVGYGSIEVLARPRAGYTGDDPHVYAEDSDSGSCICHAAHTGVGSPLLRGVSGAGTVCVGCHEPGIQQGEYADPFQKSSHPLGADDPDGSPLECVSCHRPVHTASEPLDAMLLVNGTWVCIAATDTPPGPNGFCYRCHGANSTLPGGDLRTFDDSAHSSLATSTQGPAVACDACHEPHTSRNTHLTKYADYMLCVKCHNSSDPATDLLSRMQANSEPGTQMPLLPEEQAASGGKIQCQNCHNTHAATSSYPLVDPYDPSPSGAWSHPLSDLNQYCFTCHGGKPLPTSAETTIWADPVTASNGATTVADIKLAYGVNVHGNGSIPDTDTAQTLLRPDMGYSATDGPLDCRACHDVHASSNSFQLNTSVESRDGTKTVDGLAVYPVPSGGYDLRFFCSACHLFDPETHDPLANTDTSVFPTDCVSCHTHLSHGVPTSNL